ncbi:MAG: hypothetical protein AAB263_10620, partial [Planctomycetota bacterium]
MSGATCVWTGAVDTDWNTPGNWTGGVPGNTDTADLSAGGTVTVNVAKQVGQITGALTADLILNGAFALTLNNATGVTALTTATGKTATISCPLIWAVDQTWDATADVFLAGGVTGSKNFTWSGTSTLEVSSSIAVTSANTITVNGGIYRCTHASGLGNTNGVFVVVNAAQLWISNLTLTFQKLTLNDGSTFGGIGAVTFGVNNNSTFAITVNGTTTLAYSSATDVFTILGDFKQGGNIIIAGAVGTKGGKVVFSGQNGAHTNGNFTVNQHATLQADNNAGSLGAAGGTQVITVNSGGTLRFAPTAAANLTWSRPITINGDGVDGVGAIVGAANGA